MKTSHRLKLVGLLSWCIAMIALSTPAQAQTEYDIWICGTQVTSENCGDLSVIEGVNGTVTYDPTTNTLTLQRATINIGEEGQAIYSEPQFGLRSPSFYSDYSPQRFFRPCFRPKIYCFTQVNLEKCELLHSCFPLHLKLHIDRGFCIVESISRHSCQKVDNKV